MTDTLPVYPLPRERKCPFDPPPALRDMLDVARVRLWNDSTPWLVTDHDAQRAVLADPRTSADPRNDGYPSPGPAFEASIKDSRTFIVMDDPEHARLRRMLTKNFTVKRVEAMRPRVQQIVDEAIDAVLAGPQPTDLVEAFALPVPSRVICELLGVPYADHEFFQRCSKTLVTRDIPIEEVIEASNTLQDYLLDLIDTKDADPDEDLLSRLVVENVRTGNLSREDAAAMALLMLTAGHETTANMIALGTLALLRHPDQLAELRETDDPELVSNAVEELLRYLTVVNIGLRRVATEDLNVGGRLVQAGEGLVVASDIGNRDEKVFADPDTLDIHRQTRHHMAFGHGVHQCLGQPLARLELQVVYSTLYRRMPGLALAIPFQDVEFKHEMNVFGVHSLPVTW